MTKNNILFAPASIEQQNFLNCDNVDFAFYGGEHAPPFKTLLIR